MEIQWIQHKTRPNVTYATYWLDWSGLEKGITMKVITWGSQQSVSCVLSVFGKVTATNRVTIVQAYSWPVRKQQVMSEVPKCPNHILFHKYSEIFYFSKPMLEDKNKILEKSKFWREKIRRFSSQVQVAKYGTGRGYNARNIRNNFMKKGTLSSPVIS